MSFCSQRFCNPKELSEPFCTPDCSRIDCPSVSCFLDNQTLITPPGECCGECKDSSVNIFIFYNICY